MRLLIASVLIAASMAPAIAADGARDRGRLPVLHLAADGSVLAEVGVPDGSDATLIFAPELRQPSPPTLPMGATLAPATPVNVQLSPSLTLVLGADHQIAGVIGHAPAPCAPVAAPLQPNCGANAAIASHPLLDTNSVAAGLSFYRPGAIYSMTLGRSSTAPSTLPWTVPAYALEIGRPPVPVIGPALHADTSTNTLTVAGVWSLNALGALSVSGSLAESLSRSPALATGRTQDQAALGISLSRGALTGGLVGHVNSQNQPGLASAGWGGLDVGVTWRTPWSGQFLFGARNLVTYGDDALLPDPGANKALDESRERTPYVEYRQDF